MMHVDEQGTAQIMLKTNKKWKEEIKYCPACYQTGAQTQLKLYQINMYEAVYLCPNYLNCLYPQADGWYFINRSIDEMVSDVESDDDEGHLKPDIQDEVENLIQKMQSEFSQTNNDNIILNSILNSPTHNKKKTSMSMLFSEMDSGLAHLEEKVVENINENNRVLMETENKSNYIDNDLLDDLDYLLSGCNETEVSPPEGTEVSNESKFSEILLPSNSTQKEIQIIPVQPAAPKCIPETLLPLTSIKKESDSIELNDASKRIKIVSETLLTPNNIELPIDTQNLSAQCFTVERTQLNQISLKTIKPSPDEAGDSSQKYIIKTVLSKTMDTTKTQTMLAKQKNVRRSLRKTKNELPTKLKNYDLNFESD